MCVCVYGRGLVLIIAHNFHWLRAKKVKNSSFFLDQLRCPKLRGGEGQHRLGKCPKFGTFFYFEGFPNIWNMCLLQWWDLGSLLNSISKLNRICYFWILLSLLSEYSILVVKCLPYAGHRPL